MSEPTPPHRRRPSRSAAVGMFIGLTLTAAAVYSVLWTADFGLRDPSQHPLALWSSPAASIALGNLGEVTVGVLGVAITVVSIIVELAANRYTHRITEEFLSDRVNLLALSFYVLTSVLVVWITMSTSGAPQPAHPEVMTLTATMFVSLSLLTLLPYFAYVFDFLSPTRLVDRIGAAARQAITVESHRDTHAAQTELTHRIDQLGDIALKSVQNRDKPIAIAAVTAMTSVLESHAAAKATLPAAWFEADAVLADDADFAAFHPDVVADLLPRRVWLEMKVMLQLQSVFVESVGEQRDIAHLVAIHTRRGGQAAATSDDPEALVQATRFLNTLLRTSINAGDIRSAYNLLNEYRLLAETVLLTPCRPQVIGLAEHMKNYGQLAFKCRLPFVLETAAYDLCTLLEAAYRLRAPEHEAMLRTFLDVDREPEGGAIQEQALRGVRKAQIKLATFYLASGEQALARRIGQDMVREPAARLASIREELERTTDSVFWEISDRGINFDWLDPERRACLPAFFAGLEGVS